MKVLVCVNTDLQSEVERLIGKAGCLPVSYSDKHIVDLGQEDLESYPLAVVAADRTAVIHHLCSEDSLRRVIAIGALADFHPSINTGAHDFLRCDLHTLPWQPMFEQHLELWKNIIEADAAEWEETFQVGDLAIDLKKTETSMSQGVGLKRLFVIRRQDNGADICCSSAANIPLLIEALNKVSLYMRDHPLSSSPPPG